MKTTTIPTRTAWHGEGFNRFCFIEHNGNTYTLRAKHSTISVYVDIDGDDCLIGQRDTLAGAYMCIDEYTRQTIR